MFTTVHKTVRDGITVIGGGPAGALAAMAARAEKAPVRIFEKSRFPRHKVCGEFLSPEAARVLHRFDLLTPFLQIRPVLVDEARVSFGPVSKSWRMREPAFGISRYALDRFLLEQAVLRGAELREEPAPRGECEGAVVLAHGRYRSAEKGRRLFGFKAHFAGPASRRIDLLFARDLYVGVNSIENGNTNVCGLVSEPLFKRFGFNADSMLAAQPHFTPRLATLTRAMDWLITGPLVHGPAFGVSDASGIYRAGDALGFIDPFTGSGMLDAICTGALAGRLAAQGVASTEHMAQCRRMLAGQYRMAAVIRGLIATGTARAFAPVIPGQALFDWTRPAVPLAFA